MKVSATAVLVLSLLVSLSCGAPQLLTIVIPATATLGSTGLTVGGALAAKGLIKLGFAKGAALASKLAGDEEEYEHYPVEESYEPPSTYEKMLRNYVAMPKKVTKMITSTMMGHN